jgi:hypothetical protein
MNRAKSAAKPQVKPSSDATPQVDLKDLKLDLAIVDNIFEKWFKEEESLSGVLNMKLVK